MKTVGEASAFPNQAIEVRRTDFFVVQRMNRSIRKIDGDKNKEVRPPARCRQILSAACEFPCCGCERGGGDEMSSMHCLRNPPIRKSA